MNKGDIIWANDRRKHYHPIVFLEIITIGTFKAAILSSQNTKGNILMNQNHFCKYNKDNRLYNFQFKNTHLVVSNSFTKMDFWVDRQNIVGCLTDNGIVFVEHNIPQQPILCNAPIWEL